MANAKAGISPTIKHASLAFGLVLLAFLIACAVQVDRAQADESPSGTASQESTASISQTSGLPMMGNDFVWFGDQLNARNAEIGNDLIAAGKSVQVIHVSTLGDMRIAAQNIVVTDSSAHENITAAGETVSIANTQANAVAAAGQSVSVSGSYSTLTAYANKVVIDGTVNGDVVVGANEVTIGKNARILGTLYVSAPSEPVMERGAEVAHLEFTQTESSATSAEDIGQIVAQLSASFIIILGVIGIISTIIVALLAEWLFKRQTAAAATMIRTRTGATIGTGVVAAMVAPLVVIALCLFVVTLPIAGALALALFAITAVASGFAGASLFKLAFPRLGRFKCALAGGAIMGVACALPILGRIVSAAAFMYLLGYVLQCIYLGLCAEKLASAPPTTAGPMPGNQGIV